MLRICYHLSNYLPQRQLEFTQQIVYLLLPSLCIIAYLTGFYETRDVDRDRSRGRARAAQGSGPLGAEVSRMWTELRELADTAGGGVDPMRT